MAGRVHIVETGYQECPKSDGEGGGAAQRRSRAGRAPGGSSEQPHLYSKAEKRRGGLITDHPRHAHGRGYLSEAPSWGRRRSSVGMVGTSEGEVVTRCMEGSSKKRAETRANAPLTPGVAYLLNIRILSPVAPLTGQYSRGGLN